VREEAPQGEKEWPASAVKPSTAVTALAPTAVTTKVALVWHDLSDFAGDTLAIFRDPALYSLLCGYCRESENLRCGDAGLIERAFCDSCRIRLGQQLTCSCSAPRFVDPLGKVATLCRECYNAPRGRGASPVCRKGPPPVCWKGPSPVCQKGPSPVCWKGPSSACRKGPPAMR